MSLYRAVVAVGTDHHHFGRLVGWCDHFAHAHPDWEVVVQHGSSPAPQVASGVAFLDHDRLLELLAGSDVVVSHGGPATITEARRHGHRPVVVPRRPDLGEHVDNHQLLFTARLAHAELITRVDDEAAFEQAVLSSARTPVQRAEVVGRAQVPPGVAVVGSIVEDVVRAARAAQPAAVRRR